MIAFLRKNLTALNLKPNTSNVCEFSVCFSVFSKNLSTSNKSQPCSSHEISNILVHKHNFAPEFASRVVSRLPPVKNPENAGLVLSFLRESGFSDYRLEKMLKYSHRFVSASLDKTIKPKINFFREMGFSSDEVALILSGHPSTLGLSLQNKIIPSLSLLKCLLGSVNQAARVIRIAPRVLSMNMENTMLQNVEFMKCCGVSMERIHIVLLSFPSTFLLKPEFVRKSAKKAEEMGIDASMGNFIYAVQTISSMSSESWELKLQALRSLGFSDNDIFNMFRRSPQVFAVSVEKIKKIIEILLNTRKYTISSIVMCPKSLQFSIEKRYVPRLQILGNLEDKNLIKEWPSLSSLATLSEARFFERFMCPSKLCNA